VDVVLTPSALAELLEAIAYVQRRDPAAAERFRIRVATSLAKLEDFPLSGRSLPELPQQPFREVIASPYRVFYRVEKETVWVVAFWHLARAPWPESQELEWGPPQGREGW
jgi:toxin ParE1/3/4